MIESTIIIGKTNPLVGTLTESIQSRSDSGLPGVILLNAGIIHRVGPGRLYVRLARRLAEKGLTTLRFDHSGIGDSGVRKDNQTFWTSAVLEIREAMDELKKLKGIKRFVLIGICSGAVTAFKAANIDERIVGIVMINAQGFDPDQNWNLYVSNRYEARYYRKKLFEFNSWKRFFTGRTKYLRKIKVLGRQFKNLFSDSGEVLPVVERLVSQMQNLIERKVRMLLIYSEWDQGLDYLKIMLGKQCKYLLSSSTIQKKIVSGADHSFILLRNQNFLFSIIENWVRIFLNSGPSSND